MSGLNLHVVVLRFGEVVRDVAIVAATRVRRAFGGGRRRALMIKQVGASLAGADVHSAVARNADSTTTPSRRLATTTSASITTRQPRRATIRLRVVVARGLVHILQELAQSVLEEE